MASTKLKNKTTLFRKPLTHSAPSKIVRISVTDHDATDTSSDEEDNHPIDQHGLKNQRRLNKRIINEVRIEEVSQNMLHDNNNNNNTNKYYYDHPMQQNPKKYRGVRTRPWGKFAAEIWNPLKKTREWIGTFDTAKEAALAYDRLAIMYRGSNAQTNIIPPPTISETHHDVIVDEFVDECRGNADVGRSLTSVLSSGESDFKVGDETHESLGYFDVCGVMFGFEETVLWEERSYMVAPPENVFCGDFSLDSVGDFRSCKWDVEDFFQDQCVGDGF